MTFTVQVNPLPCQHVTLTFNLEAGEQIRRTVTRDDFQVADREQAVLGILRNAWLAELAAGKTMVQAKQAVEAMTFRL